MGETLLKLFSAFVNFVIFLCGALSLTEGDVKRVIIFSLTYSFIGFLLSETIPPLLLRRGTVSREEAKYLSGLLLVGWVVGVIYVLPKLFR
jgi:hypothetical protein